jgi:hypothetical protein
MRTKEIKPETRIQRVRDFISKYKFLSDKKYYKTNKVSVAAYDSWAAQGQAGGCCLCPVTNYFYGIHNKRYTTIGKNKGRAWSWQEIGGNLCSGCYDEIEKQCNYKFEKF